MRSSGPHGWSGRFGVAKTNESVNISRRDGADVSITAADGGGRARLVLNPLTPNDHYSGRTAPLTSKVAFYIFLQQI